MGSAFTGKRRNASSYDPRKAAQCPHPETFELAGARGARICGECQGVVYPPPPAVDTETIDGDPATGIRLSFQILAF